jgi:hypothetical protein
VREITARRVTFLILKREGETSASIGLIRPWEYMNTGKRRMPMIRGASV